MSKYTKPSLLISLSHIARFLSEGIHNDQETEVWEYVDRSWISRNLLLAA